VHRALRSFPTRRSSDLSGIFRGSGLSDVEREFGERRAVAVAIVLAGFAAFAALVFAAFARAALAGAAGRRAALARGFLGFVLERSEEHTSELQSRENLV